MQAGFHLSLQTEVVVHLYGYVSFTFEQSWYEFILPVRKDNNRGIV